MLRLNRGYQSLFETLVQEQFPWAAWVDDYFYQGESQRRRWNPHPHDFQQITGAFQPLADMLKDLVDTFKGYKVEQHLVRDITQPIRGIGNLLRGFIQFPLVPLVFVGTLFKDLAQAQSFSDFFLKSGKNMVRSFSWVIEGSLCVVRGITQVLTTPLLIPRLILRGMLSAYCHYPKLNEYPLIEENTGIRKIFHEGSINNFPENDSLKKELHRKYLKSIQRGQETHIPQTLEQAVFDNGNMKTYLNLFSPYRACQTQSLEDAEEMLKTSQSQKSKA